MVHHFPDLFFCIFILGMVFRYDIPDQFMVPFTVALLVCIHRVTVEHTALDLPGIRIRLYLFRICEFTSPVSQDNLKKHREFFFFQGFPELTEDFCY